MSDQYAGDTGSDTPSSVVVLVIDDHALFRGTVERYLREASDDDIHVVNTAAGAEALAVAAAVHPEIVLVELGRPLARALEQIARVRQVVPGAGIIALRWGDNEAEEAQALAAGADRCLAKGTLDTELIHTIDVLRSAHRLSGEGPSD